MRNVTHFADRHKPAVALRQHECGSEDDGTPLVGAARPVALSQRLARHAASVRMVVLAGVRRAEAAWEALFGLALDLDDDAEAAAAIARELARARAEAAARRRLVGRRAAGAEAAA